MTVAFVHFDGLDARLAEQGPERTAIELETLVSTVAQACAAHDVALLATDVDADGGKFLLTAGAPSVRGHEEERMLATARRIVGAGLAIPVRVGVNRGPVFAGDVGPLKDEGFYIAPHIFTDVGPTSSLAREEIFGPVLAVLRSSDLDHALQVANGTQYQSADVIHPHYMLMSAQLRGPDDSYELLRRMESRGLMPPWGLVENVTTDLTEYAPMLGSLNAAFECLGAYHLAVQTLGRPNNIYQAALDCPPLARAIETFYPRK